MTQAYVESAHDYEVRFLECWGVLEDKVIFANHFFNQGNGKVAMRHYELKPITPSILGRAKFDRAKLEDVEGSIEIPFKNDTFTLPKLGFINYSFFTLFYARRHKRSSPSRYRRGFRRDTVSINVPSLQELDALFRANNPLRRMNQDMLFENSAYDLFFPKFFTYEEALEEVLSGRRLSAAISHTVAIKIDAKYNSIILMKNNWNAGDYDEKTGSFVMRTSLFNEDFEELGVKIA